MTKIPSSCSVLIVGAGPAGLMMAAQLLKNGIHPVIIDSNTQPSKESKALLIQSRTLETFRQLGLDEAATKQGNTIDHFFIHNFNDETTSINLTSVVKQKTKYPYVLLLEQSKAEKMLIDYLTVRTCPIFWNTQLVHIDVSDVGARAEVKKNGETINIEAKWVIGADGANSSLRKGLNISFPNISAGRQEFYIADISTEEELEKNVIHLFIKDEGFAYYFPMADKRSRFIGTLPQTLKHKNELSFNDIKPYLTYTLELPVQVKQSEWFIIYKTEHKIAETFRSQNCFLIGDAAHFHSPIVSEGMNNGIEDAVNLAWKLAGVINGYLPQQILQTYSEERKAAANVPKPDLSILPSQHTPVSLIRSLSRKILSGISRKKSSQHPNTDTFIKAICPSALSYRNSYLSVHHSNAEAVKAGDRLPYIAFYDEKRAEETDLHSWCSKPGFTLIVVGKLNNRDLFLLAKWITSTFPHNLNFYYLPPSPKNQHVFDLLEIKENSRKSIIVRPDLHIGYIADAVVIEMLDSYLKSTVGWLS